ncbi:Ubiquinone/menaquinone biosynthesis C-methyltransferase UbiE [Candidatus Tiddalikarchaeum anstoanum]|nr:Ubiquinone/menaquinone biosynthesis C-methyltransferase UbiE [Candidatus Tiddalikarchaeum anstoanum]
MSDILGTNPLFYYSKNQSELYDKSGAFLRIQTGMTLDALEIANFKKDSLILDLGCGTGFSTRVLLDKGFDAVGCDISRNMIILAKNKKIKKLAECDIRNLPFKDESFDGAVSISTVQWLKPEEYETALSELSRVLKKGSTAIVQFYPKNPEEFDYFILKAKNKKFKVEVYTVGEGKKEKKYIKLKNKQ